MSNSIDKKTRSEMTPEQKREYLELLIKKSNAVDIQKKQTYRPNRAQDLFHRSPKRVRVIYGGNRGGKSYSVAVEAKWFATGTHPYRENKVPCIIRMISGHGFESGIEQALYPKIKEVTPEHLILREERNNEGVVDKIMFRNGSVIYLMSGKQPQESFESAAYDVVIFDEPPKREIFIPAVRGVIDRHGCVLMAMTLTFENPNTQWIYDDLLQPFELGDEKICRFYDFIPISMYDNLVENGGVITREDIEFYEAHLSDDEVDVRIKGIVKRFSGRVYSEYKENLHVIEPFQWDSRYPIMRGVDPHGAKPHGVVWVGVMNDKFYVIKELKTNNDCLIEELAFQIADIEKENGWNIEYALVDPSLNIEDRVRGVNQLKLLNDTLKLYGVEPCMLAQKRDQLMPGIMYIKSLLKPKKDGQPDLFIFSDCYNIRKEFMKYKFDEKTGRPKIGNKKKHDDLLDPLRYLISRNYSNHIEESSVSVYKNTTQADYIPSQKYYRDSRLINKYSRMEK